jgi:hypothetical protein
MGGNNSDAHSCLVKAVLDYLRVNGAWVFKVGGGNFQKPGVPDVLACIHGRLISVECKTGRGKLSPTQQVERDGLLSAGAVFVECRQIEELEDALIPLGLVRFRLAKRQPRLVPLERPARSVRSRVALRKKVAAGN